MVRPVRFTRHYTLGLLGGFGFGLFVTLSLLGDILTTESFPRKLLGVAGLLVAMVTQFLYVRQMKQLFQQGDAGAAEPTVTTDAARSRGSDESYSS